MFLILSRKNLIRNIHNKNNQVEPENEITIMVNNEKLNHECNDK